MVLMTSYDYCCDYNGGTFDALHQAYVTAVAEVALMINLEMMATLIEWTMVYYINAPMGGDVKSD